MRFMNYSLRGRYDFYFFRQNDTNNSCYKFLETVFIRFNPTLSSIATITDVRMTIMWVFL
jgi:hypothetical protein